MAEFEQFISKLRLGAGDDKKQAIDSIVKAARGCGYEIVDVDASRPWGGFVRFAYKDGDRFIEEFFPGVDPAEARLGNPDAELSPKILVVQPKQRLSWQVHARRAERWVFLTDGGYHTSSDPDDQGELIKAKAGDVVQFEPGACHRLVGADDNMTLVAEIWQHTVGGNPSDEDDIARLQDDYNR